MGVDLPQRSKGSTPAPPPQIGAPQIRDHQNELGIDVHATKSWLIAPHGGASILVDPDRRLAQGGFVQSRGTFGSATMLEEIR
jgi:hypothetical protein